MDGDGCGDGDKKAVLVALWVVVVGVGDREWLVMAVFV